MLTAACVSQILDDLATLDSELGPGGIYAADRDLIFTKVLFPAIKGQGCRIAFSRGGKYAYFSFRAGGDGAYVYLETVSRVKVRHFGNRHRVDRHVHHETRWDEKGMGRLIARLWNDSPHDGAGLVLVVGYDAVAEPLRDEFGELEPALGWNSRGVEMQYKEWPDPHGRGFFTGASCWHRRERSSEG